MEALSIDFTFGVYPKLHAFISQVQSNIKCITTKKDTDWLNVRVQDHEGFSMKSNSR